MYSFLIKILLKVKNVMRTPLYLTVLLALSTQGKIESSEETPEPNQAGNGGGHVAELEDYTTMGKIESSEETPEPNQAGNGGGHVAELEDYTTMGKIESSEETPEPNPAGNGGGHVAELEDYTTMARSINLATTDESDSWSSESESSEELREIGQTNETKEWNLYDVPEYTSSVAPIDMWYTTAVEDSATTTDNPIGKDVNAETPWRFTDSSGEVSTTEPVTFEDHTQWSNEKVTTTKLPDYPEDEATTPSEYTWEEYIQEDHSEGSTSTSSPVYSWDYEYDDETTTVGVFREQSTERFETSDPTQDGLSDSDITPQPSSTTTDTKELNLYDVPEYTSSVAPMDKWYTTAVEDSATTTDHTILKDVNAETRWRFTDSSGEVSTTEPVTFDDHTQWSNEKVTTTKLPDYPGDEATTPSEYTWEEYIQEDHSEGSTSTSSPVYSWDYEYDDETTTVGVSREQSTERFETSDPTQDGLSDSDITPQPSSTTTDATIASNEGSTRSSYYIPDYYDYFTTRDFSSEESTTERTESNETTKDSDSSTETSSATTDTSRGRGWRIHTPNSKDNEATERTPYTTTHAATTSEAAETTTESFDRWEWMTTSYWTSHSELPEDPLATTKKFEKTTTVPSYSWEFKTISRGPVQSEFPEAPIETTKESVKTTTEPFYRSEGFENTEKRNADVHKGTHQSTLFAAVAALTILLLF